MTVFRIANRKYPVDSSEGARITGGRWNQIGTPVIYTAASKSQAALEIIAHHSHIPAIYQIITISIPDDVAVETVQATLLSENWRVVKDYTAKVGTFWTKRLRTAVLKVPSAIFADEWNYVLNPVHPDFARITFAVTGEPIDLRLKAK